MASTKDCSTPPPVIGKIGPYTVFLTPPPSSPKTPSSPAAAVSPGTPKKISVQPQPEPPVLRPVVAPPVPRPLNPVVAPPVQPPPAQFTKPSPNDNFGFFRNAISKVQNAHSSVDEYVAGWLGLNQSKYQWALDDYYESKGLVTPYSPFVFQAAKFGGLSAI